MRPDPPIWSVPRCWPGLTVAILCGGPSLTQDQVEYCRRWPVIAINRAYALAPWASWLYGSDPGRHWKFHAGEGRLPDWPDVLDCPGIKISVSSPDLPPAHAAEIPRLVEAGVQFLRHPGVGAYEGASDDPGVVRGNNSLFQILSVIGFTGASRVLLLGADMRERKHWHGGYPGIGHPNYARDVVPKFRTLMEPLKNEGVEVLNCSPGSALDAFTHVRLEDVWPVRVVAGDGITEPSQLRGMNPGGPPKLPATGEGLR